MKRIVCLALALMLLLGCVAVQAQDDQAARYAQGMQLIAQGKYGDAYVVFMGLAGYEDADAKAYALGFTKVAKLERISDTSAQIKYTGFGTALYGMVDFTTNTVTPPQWLECKILGDNRLAVKKGDYWGVIDGSGSVIFAEQWYNISDANNGVCVTYVGGLYGMINLDGRVLLNCEWKQIGGSVFVEDEGYRLYTPVFYSGLIRVQNASGLWGYADRDGTLKIQPAFAYAEEFSGDQAVVLTMRGYANIIDTTGTEVYFNNDTYFSAQYEADYAAAVQLREAGQYDEAIAAFTALGVYSDSATQVKATYYAKGEACETAGDKGAAYDAFMAAGDYGDAAARAGANYTVRAGDYITFGHYPQTSAGNDSTPIEWLVLDVQGTRALVISRYALDSQPYNTKKTSITWEKCSLRTWLNNDFINRAFTTQEQSAILLTNVDNSSAQGYSGWNTTGGNNTQDRVFLLSYAEAWHYFSNDTERVCQPTAYAKKCGAYVNSKGNCYWWLRSPGSSSSSAAIVSSFGARGSSDVSNVNDAVRPAFWINLESDLF